MDDDLDCDICEETVVGTEWRSTNGWPNGIAHSACLSGFDEPTAPTIESEEPA